MPRVYLNMFAMTRSGAFKYKDLGELTKNLNGPVTVHHRPLPQTQHSIKADPGGLG